MQLVLERVLRHLGTGRLSAVALSISVIASVPLAILSAASYRGSIVDRIGLLISLVGQSFPTFWLAIMLILIFSERTCTCCRRPAAGRGKT